jgi:hypothetical protein
MGNKPSGPRVRVSNIDTEAKNEDMDLFAKVHPASLSTVPIAIVLNDKGEFLAMEHTLRHQ